MVVVGEMHVGKGREEKGKGKGKEREGHGASRVRGRACRMRDARGTRIPRLRDERATGADSRARVACQPARTSCVLACA